MACAEMRAAAPKDYDEALLQHIDFLPVSATTGTPREFFDFNLLMFLIFGLYYHEYSCFLFSFFFNVVL